MEQVVVADALSSVVCYTEAPGERPEGAALTAEFFQNWGQLIGKLHALTTRYLPSSASWQIAAWHEGIADGRQAIPADQGRVLEKFDALVAHCQTLPTDQQSFGLIEATGNVDLHCYQQIQPNGPA